MLPSSLVNFDTQTRKRVFSVRQRSRYCGNFSFYSSAPLFSPSCFSFLLRSTYRAQKGGSHDLDGHQETSDKTHSHTHRRTGGLVYTTSLLGASERIYELLFLFLFPTCHIRRKSQPLPSAFLCQAGVKPVQPQMEADSVFFFFFGAFFCFFRFIFWEVGQRFTVLHGCSPERFPERYLCLGFGAFLFPLQHANETSFLLGMRRSSRPYLPTFCFDPRNSAHGLGPIASGKETQAWQTSDEI